MAQPVGMLRFRDQRGLTQGVEASTITRIEGLSPLGEGGCISRIHFKAENPISSLDGARDLMDQFDKLVGSVSHRERAESEWTALQLAYHSSMATAWAESSREQPK